MIFGMDYLAGALYGNNLIKAHPNGFASGFFAETFGDAFPVIRKLLKTGKCPLVRINLLWEDSHNYGNKHINKIKILAKKCEALANEFPDIDVRVAPFTEHNIAKPDKYLDITQLAAPNCLIINTPWQGGFSKKYINEIHGSHKKPMGRYQYSYDGTEVTNSDVEKDKNTHKDAEVFFLWSNRFNLRWSEKDTTPRPVRIKEAKDRAPSVDYIKSIAYLAENKGIYNLDKKTLLKSHSEKHDKADLKGDKLLFITPPKVKEIILKRDGVVIGKLPYYGLFEDGRHRYYAPQMAFKYGKNVEVWAGNKKLGTVNCGFRSAPFR